MTAARSTTRHRRASGHRHEALRPVAGASRDRLPASDRMPRRGATVERATGSALGLQIIGVMKLASALLLGVAGFGIFRLINQDWGEALEHLVVRLHLDPDDRIVHGTLA